MIFGKHINRFYIKYGWMLLIGIVALVIVDFAQLKIPEYYRMMVNGMNNGQAEVGGIMKTFDMNFLLDDICRPMILIILMIILCRFVWRVCFFGAAIRVETDLRDEMFDHCKDLSQQYYQVNKVGDLMSLFTNDLETIQDSFGNGVLMLFDALVLGSLSYIKMFRMSPSMTILCTIPMVLMYIICSNLAKVMDKRWQNRQAAFSSLSDFSQESYSGIAVVKAFAKEALELVAFRKLNKKNENANVEYTKISTLLQVLITLAVESIICVILGYGGYLVYRGSFDAGMLVEFIGYFTSIVWPVMAIAMLVEMAAKGKASMERVSALLDAPIDVLDRLEKINKENQHSKDVFYSDSQTLESDTTCVPGQSIFEKSSSETSASETSSSETSASETSSSETSASETSSSLSPTSGDIEFRHLSFTYPGTSIETLHDLSFHIKAGENIGILGRTGTGKTTIVDLLARVYNVPDGTLFVGGQDVNCIPIRTLREKIAYVPQDNFLFSETISANIAFSLAEGSEEEKMEQVREAARLADVHDNIMDFPDAYATVLGERGVTVSGGQKQRISIARALMKQAQILILDDSVSAVDTRTERMILNNLKETRKGMTTLLIAHRISTIEQMDRILFIDDGRLIDFGTHKELLSRCPAYADMVARQQLEDEQKAHENKSAADRDALEANSNKIPVSGSKQISETDSGSELEKCPEDHSSGTSHHNGKEMA